VLVLRIPPPVDESDKSDEGDERPMHLDCALSFDEMRRRVSLEWLGLPVRIH